MIALSTYFHRELPMCICTVDNIEISPKEKSADDDFYHRIPVLGICVTDKITDNVPVAAITPAAYHKVAVTPSYLATGIGYRYLNKFNSRGTLRLDIRYCFFFFFVYIYFDYVLIYL